MAFRRSGVRTPSAPPVFRMTKDALKQQQKAVDSAAKDAKKQIDANADAAKAQLDADKKKVDAAVTSTNK